MPTLLTKEIFLVFFLSFCNYLNLENASVVSVSLRPARQGLEGSLLQYPATFNFSDRFFEDKAKPGYKDLYPRRLRHSRNCPVLGLIHGVIKCIKFTERS